MRLNYSKVLKELQLLSRLNEFQPVVIGTPPLGIDVPGSDIDVACTCQDLSRFHESTRFEFEKMSQFQSRTSRHQGNESIVVQFRAFGWDVELFCQSIPTEQQWGVRHFRMEQTLLQLNPELRSVVTQLKRSGLKTEPAFANALGLEGDPYQAILDLENTSRKDLAALALNATGDP